MSSVELYKTVPSESDYSHFMGKRILAMTEHNGQERLYQAALAGQHILEDKRVGNYWLYGPDETSDIFKQENLRRNSLFYP